MDWVQSWRGPKLAGTGRDPAGRGSNGPMTAPATGSPLGERLRETVRDAASAGRSLPSEPALAAALGVSRPALREELARLERAGLIRRRQGASTIANPAAFELAARFDEQVEYADALREAFEAVADLMGWGLDDLAGRATGRSPPRSAATSRRRSSTARSSISRPRRRTSDRRSDRDVHALPPAGAVHPVGAGPALAGNRRRARRRLRDDRRGARRVGGDPGRQPRGAALGRPRPGGGADVVRRHRDVDRDVRERARDDRQGLSRRPRASG